MGAGEGRVALVTGAASGIGRSAAEQLGAQGARVLVVDLDEAGGRATVETIEKAGGEARFHAADVSDEAAVDAMVADAVATWGRLDAALNNAGISDEPRAFTDMPLAAWDRMIRINLTSVFLCLRAELRQMLGGEHDGSNAIVSINAGAGGTDAADWADRKSVV